MRSSATKKNTLSRLIGPPIVPPNCSRWKSVGGVPSEASAVSPSRRWKWNRLPCEVVRARFGDDVDNAARGAAELRVGAVGYDLEFLHRLHA